MILNPIFCNVDAELIGVAPPSIILATSGALIEGGATPISSASTLQKMGFKIILYPLSVLFANTFASLQILKELKKSGTTTKLNKKLVSFDEFNDIVELSKFRKLEKRYGTLNKKKKSR